MFSSFPAFPIWLHVSSVVVILFINRKLMYFFPQNSLVSPIAIVAAYGGSSIDDHKASYLRSRSNLAGN